MAGGKRSKPMNTMIINDHKALISYDPEIDMLSGEFIGLHGEADFYAKDIDSLHREGEISLRVYLDMCREKGLPLFRIASSAMPSPTGRKRTPNRWHGSLIWVNIWENLCCRVLLQSLLIGRYAEHKRCRGLVYWGLLSLIKLHGLRHKTL